MIEPAVTSWPANTLTPRRWAFESRPFFEEPSPFLCAIGCLLRRRLGLLAGPRLLGRSGADRLDLDPGELGAVAARLLEAALGLEREDLELLAAQVLDQLGGDGSLERGSIGDHVIAAGHQHLGGERLARLDRLPVDEELLPLLDAVLLAAHLDHCIH